MVSPLPTALLGGTATVLATLSLAGVADAKGTQVLNGSLAAGGAWQLSIYHQNIGTISGVCLDLAAQLADGTDQGTATGCAAGSLKVAHGILPLTSTARAGATVTSSLIGGVVTSKAHDVRITFANGHHLKLTTKPGPKAWRRVLKMNVRYFGGDLLPVSTGRVISISAYDRHGHRLVRTKPKH